MPKVDDGGNNKKNNKRKKGKEKKKILNYECVWYCGSCCGCGLKKIVL
jgi:uncharacterized protein YuzB (UPF0349 family)